VEDDRGIIAKVVVFDDYLQLAINVDRGAVFSRFFAVFFFLSWVELNLGWIGVEV
jgi:hypothetical protein